MASEEPVWLKVSPPDAPARVQYCPYCVVSTLRYGYQLQPRKTLFEYELAVETSHSGNSAGTSRTIEGATITFDSPESWAKAAADMIRRTAQKTDNRMGDLRRRQRNETEARQRQAEWRAEELRASEEKHRKL